MEEKRTTEEVNGNPVFKRPSRFVKYKCKRCPRKFKDIKLLHDHLQAHRNKAQTGKYKCKLCPEIFGDFFEFIRHKKGHRGTSFDRQGLSIFCKEGEEDITGADDCPEFTKSSHLQNPQNGRHEDLVTQVHGLHDSVQHQSSYGETEDNVYQLHSEPDDSQTVTLISPSSHGSIYSSTFSDSIERKPCENFVKMVGTDALQIDSPTPLKSIYLNTSTPEMREIASQIKAMNTKLDAIIRHFNVPLESLQAQESPPVYHKKTRASKPHRVNVSSQSGVTTTQVSSYHSSSKEQDSQEFYTTPITPTNVKPWTLSTSPTMYSNPTSYSFPKEDHQTDCSKMNSSAPPALSPVTSSLIKTNSETLKDCMLTEEQIEKLYVVSRSRGNFAKNLTFAVYSAEERHGRNCTGRVFGKAIPKGQLDQTKLNYVKELTFRKYPCHPSLVDFTWKKKCVTAIDSGLRNENRVRTRRQGQSRLPPSHVF